MFHTQHENILFVFIIMYKPYARQLSTAFLFIYAACCITEKRGV